jgi:hypothetical protein
MKGPKRMAEHQNTTPKPGGNENKLETWQPIGALARKAVVRGERLRLVINEIAGLTAAGMSPEAIAKRHRVSVVFVRGILAGMALGEFH